jgi:hypothetical protein
MARATPTGATKAEFPIVVDFVEEVEEQLRSDRYRTLARRVLPWFIVAVVALVVGWLAVWGYHAWRDRNVASASIGYDKGITVLAQGDETGAYTAFDAIGKSGPPAYRTLALMQQGNIRLAANKTEEAAAFYDAAAKAAPNAIFGDLARLKAALALLDTAPYPQLQVRLQALIGDKKPYGIQAREALAMAKLLAGKTQGRSHGPGPDAGRHRRHAGAGPGGDRHDRRGPERHRLAGNQGRRHIAAAEPGELGCNSRRRRGRLGAWGSRQF